MKRATTMISERNFQHLAFFQHAKAVLKPAKEKKGVYRVENLRIHIAYSSTHGAEVGFIDHNSTPHVGRFLLTISAQVHPLLPARLDRWRNALKQNLTFRERLLLVALLNFSPPEHPPA